jgi:hypothetical protein
MPMSWPLNGVTFPINKIVRNIFGYKNPQECLAFCKIFLGKENMSKVAQLLVEGKLQAMTVSHGHGGKRVAIALFHTDAYALWEGQVS